MTPHSTLTIIFYEHVLDTFLVIHVLIMSQVHVYTSGTHIIYYILELLSFKSEVIILMADSLVQKLKNKVLKLSRSGTQLAFYVC